MQHNGTVATPGPAPDRGLSWLATLPASGSIAGKGQALHLPDKSTATAEHKSRFANITPRFKVNVVSNDAVFFELGLIPFVRLPTTRGHLGIGAVEGGLGIPYSFDVPGQGIGFQSTFHFNRLDQDGGYHTEFENSVSIGHPVIGKLSAVAEFFSSVRMERAGGWFGTMDTPPTCQVGKNLRLDGGDYLGVTEAADEWHPWIAVSCRD